MTAMKIKDKAFASIADVANSGERVSGFTHDFYNYPARFSPLLARELISQFSRPGDLILDPFMGGGTTLIEAKLMDRYSVGCDISTLSSFLTNVKLNPLTVDRFEFFRDWLGCTINELSTRREVPRPEEWIERGYQRNLSTPETWPIRKLIEQYLYELSIAPGTPTEKNFMRCVVLKTAQWALDSKKVVPSTSAFKEKLISNYDCMLDGSRDFWSRNPVKTAIQINCSADQVHNHKEAFVKQPKLVLTSPPYPGVHVVYHRWQIFGRKETPAPFWIANSQDGHGLSHYAMGDRKQKGLSDYFSNIQKSYSSISKICDRSTIVVQVLAFSEISWQLPKYLSTMERAGFEEIVSSKKRIWRAVPNRKWYASKRGLIDSGKEVLLFHRLAR